MFPGYSKACRTKNKEGAEAEVSFLLPQFPHKHYKVWYLSPCIPMNIKESQAQ